ncbi:unnamed protein product [Musa acuminata subsp. malaccensis]|uniref:(wild Malaysian banana) hypothetical protein n=1 Tax=Musa acuminata subsp. malaccensis TaxID=214687 RepID=A0A8D7FPS4_MUSAM|nr:unnamed protein product [Musa acuminata subsp. malaccensis]
MASAPFFLLLPVALLLLVSSTLQQEEGGLDEIHTPQTYIVRVRSDLKPSVYPEVEHWYSATLRSLSSSSSAVNENPARETYRPRALLHVYRTVFHGFSAVLSSAEADLLSSQPGVLAVFPDRRQRPHTTRSPQFLGLLSPRLPPQLPPLRHRLRILRRHRRPRHRRPPRPPQLLRDGTHPDATPVEGRLRARPVLPPHFLQQEACRRPLLLLRFPGLHEERILRRPVPHRHRGPRHTYRLHRRWRPRPRRIPSRRLCCWCRLRSRSKSPRCRLQGLLVLGMLRLRYSSCPRPRRGRRCGRHLPFRRIQPRTAPPRPHRHRGLRSSRARRSRVRIRRQRWPERDDRHQRRPMDRHRRSQHHRPPFPCRRRSWRQDRPHRRFRLCCGRAYRRFPRWRAPVGIRGERVHVAPRFPVLRPLLHEGVSGTGANTR